MAKALTLRNHWWDVLSDRRLIQKLEELELSLGFDDVDFDEVADIFSQVIERIERK